MSCQASCFRRLTTGSEGERVDLGLIAGSGRRAWRVDIAAISVLYAKLGLSHRKKMPRLAVGDDGN